MTLNEAQKLIGTKRIHPPLLSVRKRLPVPGSGGTVHECLRIKGWCVTGKDDTGKHYHFEDYEKAWVTAYRENEYMWINIDQFATWELAPEKPTNDKQRSL